VIHIKLNKIFGRDRRGKIQFNYDPRINSKKNEEATVRPVMAEELFNEESQLIVDENLRM